MTGDQPARRRFDLDPAEKWRLLRFVFDAAGVATFGVVAALGVLALLRLLVALVIEGLG